MTIRKSSRLFGGLLVMALAFLCVSPVSAVPILGGKLIYTGGTVTVETLAATAGYTSDLDLYLYNPSLTIVASLPDFGTNFEVGHSVTFSPSSVGYAVGSELMFGIYVRNTGDTFLMGEASRNADGEMHAAVDSLGGGVYTVGFEDIFGGGDRDYDDNVFKFTGGVAATGVPEPASMLLIGLGVGALGLVKRRLSAN